MALSLAPLILFCAEKSAVRCANGKMSENTRKIVMFVMLCHSVRYIEFADGADILDLQESTNEHAGSSE